MKNKKLPMDLAFLFGMFWIEILFRCITFSNAWNLTFLNVLCLTASFALGISFVVGLLPVKLQKWVYWLILLFFGIYAYAEMEFKNYLGNYMSFKLAGNQGGRITDYIVSFIVYSKWYYFLTLVPAIVFLWIARKEKKDSGEVIMTKVLVTCFTFLAVYIPMDESTYALFENPTLIEKSLYQFGVVTYFIRDVSTIGTTVKTTTLQDETSTSEELISEENTTETAKEHKTIDDDLWNSLYESETDEDIKTIDSYLMNRSTTSENEMTGTFEGYNLIYIMVEAYDYMAVDEELTPTLYKMWSSGWHFDNYYTPKYSCTTGESEFIGLTSLVPQADVCTPNTYSENSYPEGIFAMYQNAGYTTYAFHNWVDEFYDRRILYSSMGNDNYYNLDDLDISLVQGWQSDSAMVEQALPYFVNEDHFMTLMVTSTTHFPYDESSYYGDLNLDKVKEVHPDYPENIQRYLSKAMELDKALEELLSGLEEAGKLDNTLIVLFADHHPLRTEMSDIAACTVQIDRTVGLNEDRTPAFIYNPNLESTSLDKVASTFDLLPTVMNLMGIDYDSRLYMGTDYFSDKEDLVIFTNGDWVTDEGIYYASTGTFEGDASEDYVTSTTNKVINSTNISQLIYQTDYFSKRKELFE